MGTGVILNPNSSLKAHSERLSDKAISGISDHLSRHSYIYVPSGLSKLEDESPVDILTFIDSDAYLGRGDFVFPAAKWILDLFYNPQKYVDDLLNVGVPKAAIDDLHFNELVLMIGMRSLKSVLSALIAAYETYRCLCLPDPALAHNLMPGTNIEIATCATSEEQAANTVWPWMVRFILESSWGSAYVSILSEMRDSTNRPLFSATGKRINFDHKHIICRCLHSRSAGLFGVTRRVMVIDEIARFDSDVGPRSAEKVYEAAVATTKSAGKHAIRSCISAPLHEHDMINKLYNSCGVKFESPRLAEKYIPCADFQDLQTSLTAVGFHFPTWELNPHTSWESFETERRRDSRSFWCIFGALPPGAEEPFFLNTESVRNITRFGRENPIDEDGKLLDSAVGSDNFDYYLHVDPGLGRPCKFGVALGHIEPRRMLGDDGKDSVGYAYIIDLVWEIPPDPDSGEVNFIAAEEFILQLLKRYRVTLMSSDRWNEVHLRQRIRRFYPGSPRGQSTTLKRQLKMQHFSVGLEHYSALKEAILNGLVDCAYWPHIVDELLQLSLLNNKKVSPSQGSHKDAADCVAAIVFHMMEAAGMQRSYGSAAHGALPIPTNVAGAPITPQSLSSPALGAMGSVGSVPSVARHLIGRSRCGPGMR